MNKKQLALDKVSKEYILSCISSDGYDQEPKTDPEKLRFLYDTFISEKGWEIKRIGLVPCFEDWIRGLPSSFNIDFSNYDILELAKKWDSIPLNATEDQEHKILDNYFNFITAKTFQLFRKHDIY